MRRDLQGMRALAVLGVVIYHLRPSWLPGGFAGVDVFFVLSGFFITGHLLREVAKDGRVDLVRFWTRRIRRLLPAATVVLVATILASLVTADVLDTKRFAQDGGAAAFFVLNWRLASQGTSYFADPDPSPYAHYWSLGVEEQFYLVWPVVLLLIVLVARRWLRPALFGIVGAASVASFAIAFAQTTGRESYAYFATYSRVWELGLGVALAVATPVLSRLAFGARWLARWGGVGLVIGFYGWASRDAVYPGWYLLVPALGAALVIASGAQGSKAAAPVAARRDPLWRVLCARPAQALGRYSYSWYLWHWPPLVLFPLWLHHRLSVPELLACGVASLGLAVGTYHLVENPVRSSRRLAAGRGWRSVVLGLALVTLSVTSCLGSGARAGYLADHTHLRNGHQAAIDPQPAQAAAEEPEPTGDGCEVSLSSSGLSGECRYLPDTGHGDVVLVGDSHAVEWYPVVHSIAAQNDWGLRVWAKASCPVADVTRKINGGPATACNAWREDVMTRLVAAKPDLVVIGSLAAVVSSVYDPQSHKLVGGQQARDLYQAGLVRELTRLRAAGIAVLLIRDNPYFDESGPKCVLAHPDHVDACSAPLHHVLKTAVDLHAAKAVPGVHWVDFTSAYCDATRCHQVVGNTLAYRDNNHLTVEMTRRLQPQLAAAARNAIAD